MEIPLEGQETFVISGGFSDEQGEHRRWSWSREACAVRRRRRAHASGCLLYVKSRHLRSPEVDICGLQG